MDWAEDLRKTEGISELSFGKALALAAYKCYKTKIRKRSIPYEARRLGMLIEREASLNPKVNITFERNADGFFDAVKQAYLRIPGKPGEFPFYAVASILHGAEEGFTGVARRARNAMKTGAASIDELFERIVHK